MSGEAGPTRPAASILVADDEPTQREMLAGILARAGYGVVTAADGKEALGALAARRFDLLLTDQRMPGLDGLALLERARAADPTLPVVLMTAHGSVSTAVQAMKQGAADYLTKPFEKDELLLVLEKALRQRRLEAEVASLRGALAGRHRFGRLIGAAPAMEAVFALIERIAPTDVPVLIQGESGTGKELVARAIHGASRRATSAFVALNCAAIPEALLESEFFGHEKGAFTGADRAHAGRFEQAHGGTLFLDEIGAMRVDLQAKLLRAIQEREVQRLGGRAATPVDVRILAATCEDLQDLIRKRAFREDLYYRLSVVPIELPALRDRVEDIPLLVEQFRVAAAARFEREAPAIVPEVLDRLTAYPWPGNVRELQNTIERLVLLARDASVSVADLPPAIRDGGEAAGEIDAGFRLPLGGVRLPQLERHLILQALERTKGGIAPAARLLGISYKTLQYRIRKHRLERGAFGAPGSGEPGDEPEADDEAPDED